jgi:cytochrome b6-f complex iron-sulfur subunit
MADMDAPQSDGEKTAAKVEYKLVHEYNPLPTRRAVLISWTGLAWGAFAVSQGVSFAALGRFMYPNVLFEPPQSFKAGRLEDFEWDKPDEKFKQQYGTWIVKLSKDAIDNRKCLIALSTTCTHLGCTPNVLFGEQKIKCPCHGSGFRFSGLNFEGPAPRPLERWKVTIDPVDGQILVDKTKKFQQEKGEWTNPDSFVPAL